MQYCPSVWCIADVSHFYDDIVCTVYVVMYAVDIQHTAIPSLTMREESQERVWKTILHAMSTYWLPGVAAQKAAQEDTLPI